MITCKRLRTNCVMKIDGMLIYIGQLNKSINVNDFGMIYNIPISGRSTSYPSIYGNYSSPMLHTIPVTLIGPKCDIPYKTLEFYPDHCITKSFNKYDGMKTLYDIDIVKKIEDEEYDNMSEYNSLDAFCYNVLSSKNGLSVDGIINNIEQLKNFRYLANIISNRLY